MDIATRSAETLQTWVGLLAGLNVWVQVLGLTFAFAIAFFAILKFSRHRVRYVSKKSENEQTREIYLEPMPMTGTLEEGAGKQRVSELRRRARGYRRQAEKPHDDDLQAS